MKEGNLIPANPSTFAKLELQQIHILTCADYVFYFFKFLSITDMPGKIYPYMRMHKWKPYL